MDEMLVRLLRMLFRMSLMMFSSIVVSFGYRLLFVL